MSAQLISPGKLAAPHAQLEGMRLCTQCHVLRARGVSSEKCLGCHVPIRTRVEAGLGFHGTLAEGDCASCHKDHFGRDFALVKFDTLSFDHGRTDFELLGSHARLECEGCHRPELIRAPDVLEYEREQDTPPRTFLGLGAACAGCHTPDDPHGPQFADRSCSSCHGEQRWEGADRFRHEETSYPLRGRHADVLCGECHAPLDSPAVAGRLEFVGLEFTDCSSCHLDVHQGARGETCAGCHTPAGWRRINRSSFESGFDHSTTEYPLLGAHRALDCALCHGSQAASTQPEGPAVVRVSFAPGSEGRAYPQPLVDGCTSCHEDAHGGALAGGASKGVCTSCHSEDAWLPVAYDTQRHNAETGFALTGAHVVTPCTGCHTRQAQGSLAFDFLVEAGECASCHVSDEPHRGQFENRGCDECHATGSFRVLDFDHGRTGYPLDETHAELECASCHVQVQDPSGAFVRYRPLNTRCKDCHGDPS